MAMTINHAGTIAGKAAAEALAKQGWFKTNAKAIAGFGGFFIAVIPVIISFVQETYPQAWVSPVAAAVGATLMSFFVYVTSGGVTPSAIKEIDKAYEETPYEARHRLMEENG